MAENTIERAERLIARGNPQPALGLLRSAADTGNVDAIFRLAIAHLVGDILPRDLAAARERLSSAVAIGHVDAALMLVALTANGSGAAPDWAGALRLLETAAQADPVAAEQLKLVHAMAIDGSGHPAAPPTGRMISQTPSVMHFAGLLTADECLHLARAADPLFEPAMVIDPRSGRPIPHPIRTSDGAVLGPAREDLVVRTINLRIAAASQTDVRAAEALTVLRYAPGQQYRPHHDAISGTPNQRAWTMLLYLNEGYVGGETRFLPSNITVRGKRGDGLLFRNLLPSGRPDPAAQHAGLPVQRGTKWLATRWIRQQPLDLWGQGR
jgi:prolyl 4-hydroxylase